MNFNYLRTGLHLMLVLGFCCASALACSVAEGSTIIEDNRFIVRTILALSVGLFAVTVLLYFKRGRKGRASLIFGAIFMLFQPGLVYGGGGGDCGRSMVENAIMSGTLITICFAYQLRAWLISRPR